ncbi:mitochondrial carrier domain-containing protein, putative [Eimeria tenella]|uniref:Mitochondrial carrier domain-containing protein, putative n=1 Tax=Eimeria tenella TaxID=5802 RepID=U6KG74_EIMTE|nr:mitochondrial carrier domain-containing protein, putative [Eimeria tenella]CDJ37040.1 mitochondrial carrier domain-containing protein, putative [Eimeria tenella]|eukprot:XP_013227878.1 mitochondrial carrier domain-containing protein, putative [Eimeria tenella]
MVLSQDEVVALAAGASTGIISDIILFPLDFLKTHAQVNAPASPSVAPPATPPPAGAALSGPLLFSRDSAETVRSISRDTVGSGARSALTGQNAVSSAAAPAATWKTPCGVESKGRPTRIGACYSGIAALAMGSMPSSAVFFVAYEMAKEKLKRLNTDSSLASTHILAASIAETSACVIRNPFEVVKQQVQLRLHETTAEGFSAVWRLEGPRGFFVGMGTSMLRDVPFAALQLSLWEWMKVKALGQDPPSTGFTATISGAAGMVAGAVAAVVTTPMDVAKTRLMTQAPGTRQVR